jgi:hypothetical protein
MSPLSRSFEMTKMFYEWEDTSDPNATGRPNMDRYPWARALTKRQVRKEWREYLHDFPKLKNPKIRVWKVSYKEVKV